MMMKDEELSGGLRRNGLRRNGRRAAGKPDVGGRVPAPHERPLDGPRQRPVPQGSRPCCLPAQPGASGVASV